MNDSNPAQAADPIHVPPGEHAKYGASSAHRWGHCAAAIQACHGLKSHPKDFTAIGTMGHEVAQLCLDAGTDADSYIGRRFLIDGFDLVFAQDQALALQVYIDGVRDMQFELDDPDLVVLIEQRVDFSEFIDVPGQFGTGDAVLISPAKRLIVVDDLKFGQGQRVDAFENEQLMLYALGAYKMARDKGYTIENVLMRIHQPRIARGFSEWAVPIAEILERVKALKTAAAKSQQVVRIVADGGTIPDDAYNAGEKACLWCEAKTTCHAASDFILDKMDCGVHDFADLCATGTRIAIEKLHGYDPRALGDRMSAVHFIKKWLEAVEDSARLRMDNGEPVTDWKLVEGKAARRNWTNENEARQFLLDIGIPRDKIEATSILTPAQSQDAIRSLMPEQKISEAVAKEMIAPLVTQGTNRPSLVKESDPRPAIAVSQGDQFQDLTAKPEIEK